MQCDVTAWLIRIEAEYREMPGLRLTREQVKRLWGLDDAICDAVIEALITRHVLVNARDMFVRADVLV